MALTRKRRGSGGATAVQLAVQPYTRLPVFAREQAGSRLGDDSKSRATVELAWSSFPKEGTPGSARDGCTPRSVIVLKIIGGGWWYAWDKRRQLCHCTFSLVPWDYAVCTFLECL